MDQRLSVVTLGVSDLAVTRRFYEALGWSSTCAADSDVVFFQCGGMIVSLWGEQDLATDSGVPLGSGFGGVTLAYNVASPAEVDVIVGEAEAAGATVSRPPGETFWGGYAGVFLDPDGHPWEVHTTRTGRWARTARFVVRTDGRIRNPDAASRGALAAVDGVEQRAAAMRTRHNDYGPPKWRPVDRKKPAASYSPRPLRAKYHRR